MKYTLPTEVFSIRQDEWQVRIGCEVLPVVWNSKGAALAGLAVEARTMSRSNPMHHATPPRPRPWPFPVTLPAPGHAPGPKPVRAPVPYPVNAPAAPF